MSTLDNQNPRVYSGSIKKHIKLSVEFDLECEEDFELNLDDLKREVAQCVCDDYYCAFDKNGDPEKIIEAKNIKVK